MIIFRLPKVFFFLILLVSAFLLQIHLINSVFQLGWAQDDWAMRAYYTTIAAHPLTFLPQVIKKFGPYFTQPYYIGILTDLFGLHFSLFRIFSILFRTFIALAIYLLVVKVTKDKLLAVAAYALYVIGYTSTADLEFVIAGPEYLVQLMLCIFLIVYHHLIVGHTGSVKWLFLLLITFAFSIAFAPIRAFPILVIPFLIEFFILVLTNKGSLKGSFIRLAVLSPVYILLLLIIIIQKFILQTHYPAQRGVMDMVTVILNGNWWEVLIPFGGLGSLILPFQPWTQMFGPVTTLLSTSFKTYLLFLLERPSLVFLLITFIFSKLLVKNRRIFFFKVMLINYLIQILAFLIYSINAVPDPNYFVDGGIPGRPFNLYPVIGGIYIFALSIGFFWEWIKEKRLNYTIFLWVGPWYSLLISTLVWLLAHSGFVFTPTHRYLMMAHFGTILFLAALLRLSFQRIFENKSRLQRSLCYFLILTIFLMYYNISYQEIKEWFRFPLFTGMADKDNEYMQQKFLQIHPVERIINSNPSLYFFDISGDPRNSYFYSRSFIDPLVHWVTILKHPTSKTCTYVVVDDYEKLKQAIVTEGNNKVFNFTSYCFDSQSGTEATVENVSVKVEDFFAYKIKDKNFIDISSQFLSTFGL